MKLFLMGGNWNVFKSLTTWDYCQINQVQMERNVGKLQLQSNLLCLLECEYFLYEDFFCTYFNVWECESVEKEKSGIGLVDYQPQELSEYKENIQSIKCTGYRVV